MRYWPFSKWTSKASHPAFEKNHSFFKELDQDKPIETFDYVVFDTELTGLRNNQDEIISIGAVRIKNLQIHTGEIFHSYIRPHRKFDATESTFIHRITPQQIVDAPKLNQVMLEFIDFCGPALLVGHYVGLDMKFFNKAAQNIFGSIIKNPCLDTMYLAQAYTEMCWTQYHDQYNLQISYNLGDLSEAYGLPLFQQHDALHDALQTAYLFVFLIKNLQKQGLVSLRDIFRAKGGLRNLL